MTTTQTTQNTTIADLFTDLLWDAPDGTNLDGYSMDAYFDGDVHVPHPTREDAITAAMLAYRGQDTAGIGLDFTNVAPGEAHDEDDMIKYEPADPGAVSAWYSTGDIRYGRLVTIRVNDADVERTEWMIRAHMRDVITPIVYAP